MPLCLFLPDESDTVKVSALLEVDVDYLPMAKPSMHLTNWESAATVSLS